ncbi:adenosine receptor A2b-like [Patella vulgata]|uniref:adenosine receptor A2b-like n=1 Tax=Patella vulgata TaxID=6465 RepID=UPI0024A9A7A0|nr:adenosine receptor A2b-like [Patella vulgata]
MVNVREFVIFSTSVASSVFFMMAIAFDRALYIRYPLRYQELVTASKAKLIVFMMTIAFDRVLYIGYPFFYQTMVTFNRAKLIIFAGCVLSLGFGALPLLSYSMDACSACAMFGMTIGDFELYGNLVSFGIVCILTSICYGYIFKIARRQRIQCCKDSAPHVMNQIEHDIKLIKIYVLVFGIFFLSWSPNLLVVIVDRFTEYPIPEFVLNITIPISLLNSGLNFLVYSARNEDFRKAFKRLLLRPSRVVPDNPGSQA